MLLCLSLDKAHQVEENKHAINKINKIITEKGVQLGPL